MLLCLLQFLEKEHLTILKHQGNYLKHKINVNLSAIRSPSNIMYCSSNCYIMCKPLQIMLHKQTYTNGLLNSNSAILT